MITFKKILAYNLKPECSDTFDYLAGVTDQSINPATLHPGELEVTADLILHSSLQRATGCLQKNDKASFVSMDELREIPFDLNHLMTRQEWEKQGSILVRKRFKKAFIQDQLLITRSQLFNEVERVLDICRKHDKENIVIVSHSFRLKLFEAYLKTNGEIKSKPELIERFIMDEERTYPFGGGFMIDKVWF